MRGGYGLTHHRAEYRGGVNAQKHLRCRHCEDQYLELLCGLMALGIKVGANNLVPNIRGLRDTLLRYPLLSLDT